MTTLHDQLAAFAQARGGVLRYGPQPARPTSEHKAKADTQATQYKPKADPWIDYTDDYSLWCRTRRGE